MNRLAWAQKLEVISRCFQRRVELKRLSVVDDRLSFVAYRLVGPAQIAIGKADFGLRSMAFVKSVIALSSAFS